MIASRVSKQQIHTRPHDQAVCSNFPIRTGRLSLHHHRNAVRIGPAEITPDFDRMRPIEFGFIFQRPPVNRFGLSLLSQDQVHRLPFLKPDFRLKRTILFECQQSLLRQNGTPAVLRKGGGIAPNLAGRATLLCLAVPLPAPFGNRFVRTQILDSCLSEMRGGPR